MERVATDHAGIGVGSSDHVVPHFDRRQLSGYRTAVVTPSTHDRAADRYRRRWRVGVGVVVDASGSVADAAPQIAADRYLGERTAAARVDSAAVWAVATCHRSSHGDRADPALGKNTARGRAVTAAQV